MSSYISSKLRSQIIERASNCCEYCLLSQSDIFFSFEVDHIISEKHDGETKSDNLCLSCPDCNRYKGRDIASIDPQTNKLAALFNPRAQQWDDHFRLEKFVIVPLTAIGRVTVNILKLNAPERVLDRALYADVGNYPCRASSTDDPTD